MNKILIHKGDSTVFADVRKFLTFNIETHLDLTGWQAKFVLGWITKEVADITSKSFEIILDAEDTKQLRLGSQNASIILTDSEGHIKTVVNNILFEVTTAVVENEYQEIDLTIPESSGVDIKLRVGMQGGTGAVNSVNGMTGDVIIDIPSLDGYVKDTDYASSTKAGVFKTDNGLTVTSKGVIAGTETSLENYEKRSYYLVMSKGTLENIKNDLVKRAVTENDIALTEEEKANAKNWLGYADSTDIMQAIASIPQFNLSIVNELPSTGAKMTLYLVPKEGTNNDVYDEYIWIEQTSSFEHLGTTAVDLTDYVKNTDYGTTSKGGVIKANTGYCFGINGNNGIPTCTAIRSLDTYNTRYDEMFISKGTLGTVLTQYSKTVLTTEADYNALETKDSNTLYLIEE